MKRVIKFISVAIFSIVMLSPLQLLAGEVPAKNYVYGVVENKNSYPVNLRVINKDGKDQICEVRAGEKIIVPVNTKAVEVYYDEGWPLDSKEQLNVEVYQSNMMGKVQKAPGFGDKVEFENPTGAFPPSYLEPNYPGRILEGACYPDEAEDLALMKLNNNNYKVRAEGAYELGEMKSKKAQEPLIKVLEKEDNMNVKRSAVWALGEVGDARATAPLLEAARKNKYEITDLVAKSLDKIGEKNSISLLREGLRDENEYVRASAACALDRTGNKEDIALLEQALGDKSSMVRECATVSLGKIEGNETTAILKKALKNEDGLVRLRAGWELKARGEKQAIFDAYKDMLKDSSEELRIEAATYIAYAGGEEAVGALTNALTDSSDSVRYYAVRGLGETGSEKAVDALIKALGDPSVNVRADAARMLGDIGSDKASSALKKALNDQAVAVKNNAQEALDKITKKTEEKKKEKRALDVKSKDPELLKLNETYLEDVRRLKEIDPNSEEAKLRRRRMEMTQLEFAKCQEEEMKKYKDAWIDKYRDESGKLPGGLLEDDRSRLVKLKDSRAEQAEKVKKLESDFEELKKKTKPVESYTERLRKDQNKFREDFVKKHGPSEKWTDGERKEYEQGFNELTKKSKEQWDKDKQAESERNRKLGRTIKELAEARAGLNQMDGDIKMQTEKTAEKPKFAPTIPFIIGEDVGLVKVPELPTGTAKSSAGATVTFIEGYAEDLTDGTIGYWNSKYPHPSFDDEEGRKGLPNGEWDGSYYFDGNMLYLVIDNLHAEWPPLHTLSIGYTVTLSGGTFADGSATKNLIVYTYSGTPGETRVVKGFSLKK